MFIYNDKENPRQRTRAPILTLRFLWEILTGHDAPAPSPSYSLLILVGLFFSAALCADSLNTKFGTGREWHASVSDAAPVTVMKDGTALCNSDAFSQIPGRVDLFLGRLKINTSSDRCSGNTWAIAHFEMNWEKKELHYVRDILSPPFTIQGDGRVIQSVYDPFAIAFGGEIWMAFECATPQSTSSCIAPLDMKGAVVTRVSVPVSGGPKTSEEQWGVSASDPKLLFFRQHLYLYWTVIRFDGQGWIDGTTRGTELVEDNLRERRLWAKDAVGQPVRSDDKKRTVEVLGLAPLDATSDTFADVFGIYTNDESVFAIAALGGHGTAPGEKCLSPLGSSFGCYRLEISRANRPLQNRAFNDGELSVVGFPENPQEYSRIVEGPNGELFIMGMYFDPPEKYAAKYQGHTVPHGLRLYPISIK